MTEAYPLQWPAHISRTPHARIEYGSFQVSAWRAKDDLLDEIRKSGGKNPVISTNVPTLRNGTVSTDSRKQKPDDCGVAIYFIRKRQSVCISCDTFDEVWKNIRAIGLSIKDMRGPETRGCAEITDQAFTGFTALPSPEKAQHWTAVLGVERNAGPSVIQCAYKHLIRTHAGNDHMLMIINTARDAALGEGQ